MNKELNEKATRLIELNKLIEKNKREADSLKAYFERIATKELENTKNKTFAVTSTEGKVSVTIAEEVKALSDISIEKVMGEIAHDFMTKEVKFKYTAPFKRLLIAAFKKDLLKESVENVIAGLTTDVEIQKVLLKKLRGINFEKDKNVFLANGFTEQEANDGAYFVAEAFNYERLKSALESAEFDGTFEEGVAKLKSAVIVEDKMKVMVEAYE